MERRAITVDGIVQGVGFRPFVYGLAVGLHLRGFVKNRTGSVRIEVEGEPDGLDRFLAELTARPPPLAQIQQVQWRRMRPVGEPVFRIEPSEAAAAAQVFLSPDVATCGDCLRELFDPADRRYRYPFLNCTNCGPRLTIITGAPYDRERTTMAAFPLCAACRSEYEDPANRRFHAQPTACWRCGPRWQLRDAAGQPIERGDPLDGLVEALRGGRIGALKGLGGYHLACDARSDAAVARLRARKHRDEKPLAIMVRDLEAADALCEFGAVERQLLASSRRPIVLLSKRDRGGVSELVAPGNPSLGVMLPYTPVHHLLLRALGETPLVMTSGNRSDEPIAYRDDEAVERLAGIADVFLVHNRPIHVRCDDSVTRVVDAVELPLRRSRGYAPQPIALPMDCPRGVLAVGGQLKATFALGRQRQAVLSHHLGDLDHFDAYRAFEQDVLLYRSLMAVAPEQIAHDMHPDYASTHYALDRAAREGLELVPVQHHHAHMASCMAENGLCGPAIGVALDGTGYGLDGAVWGGEFLVGGYGDFRRAAHLRYVAMPGGEQAIRQPWRMAAAHLIDAGCDLAPLESRRAGNDLRVVARMLERQLNSPMTSSAGRLFDAVAALLGLRDQVSYEGQAAIELEWLAARARTDGSYPFEIEAASGDAPLRIDTRPLVRAIARDIAREVSAPQVARRFHATLADLIVEVCRTLRRVTGVESVVLSGGVFLNALLTREAMVRLAQDGFLAYRHRLVPPGDGGLSLGQLAVAAGRAAAAGRANAIAANQQQGVTDVPGHSGAGG